MGINKGAIYARDPNTKELKRIPSIGVINYNDGPVKSLISDLQTNKADKSLVDRKIIEQNEKILQLEDTLNKLLLEKVSISLKTSPGLFFEGETTKVTVTANINNGSGTIIIKKGNSILGTSETNKQSFTIEDTITTRTTYTATSSYKGKNLSYSSTINSVSPIYIGTGNNYNDIITDNFKQEVKSSPKGTYNITINAEDQRIFIIIPSTMNFKAIKLDSEVGQDFPMIMSNEIINGISYKVYNSGKLKVTTITLIII